MNQIEISEVLDLMDVDQALLPLASKKMVPTTGSSLVYKSVVTRRLVPGVGAVDTVESEGFVGVPTATKNSYGLINYISEKVNEALFSQLTPFSYITSAKNDATGFRNATSLVIEGDTVTQRALGCFMNIESQAKNGSIGDTDGVFTGEQIQYKDGWFSVNTEKIVTLELIVSKKRKAGTGPLYGTPQEWVTVTSRKAPIVERKTRIFTKDQIEALGYTDEMLSELTFQKWNLVETNPETELANIALELQPVEGMDNMLFPQVWINGRDDNDFNFQALNTPWGFKMTDFTLKICGYGDITVDDLFTFDADGRGTLKPDAPVFASSENPKIFGFRGKFSESVFENENPPLIQVTEGDKYSTTFSNGVLTIQFPSGVNRKVIGFHIANKPDTGKSDFYHVFYNMKTGELTRSFWNI